jgi:two-component system, OmpR family, sensor histidine kinase MprB
VSLRTKIVVALALIAAGATVAIGVFSYRATASQLKSEIDDSIKQSAHSILEQVNRGQRNLLCGGPPGEGPGRSLIVCQLINSNGNATSSNPDDLGLPVSTRDRNVLNDEFGYSTWHNVYVDGEHYRVQTVSLGSIGAVQIARSLREYDNVLHSLRNKILIAALLVAAAAGLIGWLIARQVTRRLTTLTTTAEEVAQTGRLDIEVPVQGSDEAGRLGIAFNEMLTALARSKEDQQRLVQDAGHELRTPLTSLRTNMSVLRRHALEPDTRSQVLDDLESETRELTDLVNELVELATDRSRDEPTEDVSLAELAERVALRAQRRTNRIVTVAADDTVVVGRRQGLERAISNLVDNALKFDAHGTAPVEIVVRNGEVTVYDRGPGIKPDDLPHLFDRFFRSVDARSEPGSGLGLSIVREVAQRHGGTVFARPREGGGAAIGFTVPVRVGEPEH